MDTPSCIAAVIDISAAEFFQKAFSLIFGGGKMPHTHKIVDSDVHFIIDPATRAITSETKKLYITQYDHNSERFTFKIPRIMEGHDMMECNAILIDFNNTSTTKKDNNVGEYISTDKTEDGEFMLFSWLVSQDATKLVGSLSFSVSFICHDGDGNVVYEWGTDTYKRITVLEKARYSQAIVEKYPDVIEQIKDDTVSAAKKHVEDYAQPKGDYLTEHQSLEGYATEEYVREAIKQIDIPQGDETTNADQLAMLVEMDLVPAIHDENGAILCDENGYIVLRY